MKSNKILLISIALVLVACGGKNTSNTASSASNSSFDDASSFLSSFIESKDSSSQVDTSSFTNSTSSKTSSTSNERHDDENVIDDRTAQELIVYAGKVDTVKAQSSLDLTYAKGFDNGIRYEQSQTVNYTSYSNEITIGKGSITHIQSGNTYSDTFDRVKMIKDYTYIDATQYHSGVFNDSTQKSNLLNAADPSSAYATALEELSCGAGYLAFEDFYYIAITMQCEITYEAFYETDNRLHITFYAEASNEQSNQYFVGQYDYYFNNVNDGFLTEYSSEQAFYSYDRYISATDPSEIEPMYYGKEMIFVTEGSKTSFEGALPINVESTFVRSITLSAFMSTIEVDEVIALKATVEPKTATDKSLKFISSNESVARVDYTGRVTGISTGKCTIYAVNYASGVEGHIDITVVSKRPLDPGDDSKKGDLKEALELAKNQYLPVDNIYHDTIVGMIIDEDSPLNGEEIAKLSISDFAYDEKTRTATYVGDLKVLEKVIPFKDNGNDNLSNTYYFDRTSHIYRDSILGMEIELDALNRIGVIHFRMRTDSADKPSGLNIASLTDANVESILGEFSSGYSRSVYYESEGFYSDAKEEE